jgi:hypothetical protein
MKRILCGAGGLVCWMTPATADTLKQILMETGHNETSQERHAVDVDGCIMTTCGKNQGNSSCGRHFNLIWQGPNCPITVVRNLWRCSDQRGHRIRRLSIFKCARPLKRASKNQTGAEKRKGPSHPHAMMAQCIPMKLLSVFSICIKDRN